MQSDENTDCKALFENSDPFTAAGRAGIRRPWFPRSFPTHKAKGYRKPG